jgi:lipoprotein-anchoring transpeptidase ErfK/SrfK
MYLSSFSRLPKYALGLVAAPLLALVLAFPAAAQNGTVQTGTSPNAPAAAAPQTSQAKPDTPAEPKSEGTAAGQQSKPEDAATAQQPKSEGTAAAQPKPAAPPPPKPADWAKHEAASADFQAGSKILINIDKSRQEMTVFVDGVERYSWPVSTGKPGYATPSGNYTPTSMNEIWYSKQWDNSPMPHSIFYMKDGHAIHGTHEVKNLGKPASHGCVRLSPENALTLYSMVEKTGMENVQVVLNGETPGGEYKVASPDRRYGPGPGWFIPGDNYYAQQEPPRRRRGLFGRWFQPDYGPQGYAAPPGYQRGYRYGY